MTLSDRFFADVARLGQRRRTNPEHYLVVWCSESDLTPTAVNAHGGARGLNQMTPATLRGLGAPAAFEQLAAEDQLPWIEKLIAIRETYNGGPFESAARYYHANFFPLTMQRGDSPRTVVVAGDAEDARERAAYAANRGLDVNGDGRITLADLAAWLEHVRETRCPKAWDRLDTAVRALPSPGATWASSPAPVTSSAGGGSIFIGAALAVGLGVVAAWRSA